MDVQPIIESARERVLEIKERDGMPGVAVALVSQGQPVWMETFGATREDGGRPIDAHTIFSIQSTSKTFTATAVMLAVQQGLLDLGAPIAWAWDLARAWPRAELVVVEHAGHAGDQPGMVDALVRATDRFAGSR